MSFSDISKQCFLKIDLENIDFNTSAHQCSLSHNYQINRHHHYHYITIITFIISTIHEPIKVMIIEKKNINTFHASSNY